MDISHNIPELNAQAVDAAHAISPLAQEKTYGEHRYSQLFDWGLNYWLNLTASALFSQWAEHGTRPFKLWGMKEAVTPMQLQHNIASFVRDHDPTVKGFKREMLAKHGEVGAEEFIAKRMMARARSITLLLPGFLIMIPSVWLGAKIKPWFVETLNRKHYGEEAMDDPSLKARHEAIRAEARPTFSGALVARLLTMFVAQTAAQTIGSEDNHLNKLGEKFNVTALKEFKGVDPLTESIGTKVGGALPLRLREGYNRLSRRWGFDWSADQRAAGMAKGAYHLATENIGRFIAADTVYTAVTASTIGPFTKLLRYVPGMSYKPKVPEGSAEFEGDRIKVPANRYVSPAEGMAGTEKYPPQARHPSPRDAEEKPATRVHHVSEHEAPERLEAQRA